MCPSRRRDLLATAAGTATTLAAGCLATDDESTAPTDGDDTATTTRGDTPATTAEGPAGPTATVDGAFEATAWLPAPSDVQAGAYFAFAGDVTAPADAGVPEDARTRTRETFVGLPGDVLDVADVAEVATAQSIGSVCTFDAATSEVRERLAAAAANSDGPGGGTPTATAGEGTAAGGSGSTTTETDATSGDSNSGSTTSTPSPVTGDAPEGYLGYATDLGVYWLGADHVLYGRREPAVRAMYDARAGDVERYASNPDVAAVLDAADGADLLAFAARSQRAVESASAFAYAWRFGDVVELAAPFAFPDEASTDADAVAGLADLAGFFEYDATDVTTSGRVVTLTGELPVSEYDLLERDDGGENPGGSDETAPQVAFEFEFHRGKDAEWDGDEEERVVLTHTGGDNLALDTVVVEYDGTAVADRDAFASTEPAGDDWQAGGEWTIRASGADATFQSDATLRVIWTSDDGGSSAVIAAAQLP